MQLGLQDSVVLCGQQRCIRYVVTSGVSFLIVAVGSGRPAGHASCGRHLLSCRDMAIYK